MQLALIGNGGENTGLPVSRNTTGRMQNPAAVAGPAISLLPYPPFLGVTLGSFGWVQQNPQIAEVGGTLVANPFTGEVRRYPHSPRAAVEAAGGAPADYRPGFLRSGAWVTQVLENGPLHSKADLGSNWAFLTLELIWQSRIPWNPLYEYQVQLPRPVCRVNKHFFGNLYARGSEARKSAHMSVATGLRQYDRWKARVRSIGFERTDAYDEDFNSRTGWFAFDIPATFDLCWAILGTPHPDVKGEGEIRELELLEQALGRTPGASPTVAELRAELNQETNLDRRRFLEHAIKIRKKTMHEQIRGEIGRSNRWYKKPGSRFEARWGKAARFFAVEPELERMRAAAEAQYAAQFPAPAPVEPERPKPTKKRFGHMQFGSQDKQQKLFNPGAPRRRNRDSKWKTPPDAYMIPIEQLDQDSHYTPEVRELAKKKYKRFHSTQATKAVLFRIPDGRKEVTRDPDLHVVLHETLEKPYRVTWPSQKRGDDSKDPIVWFHEFPEGSRPFGVLNPRTGIVSEIGGSYLVDDYYYS